MSSIDFVKKKMFSIPFCDSLFIGLSVSMLVCFGIFPFRLY